MIVQTLTWMLKTKIFKVGAGSLAGGSVMALIFSLHNDLALKIDEQRIERREYVELVLRPIDVEIQNLKKETVETKSLIKDIHKHLLRNKGE